MSEKDLTNETQESQELVENATPVEEVAQNDVQAASSTPAIVIPPKEKKNYFTQALQYIALITAALIYLVPIVVIVINSFKSKRDISTNLFKIPTGDMFVGLDNFKRGIFEIGFLKSFGYSLELTVLSVVVIIVCCSMTGWYITRVKSRITTILYYVFVFSMIVPFQMVMFTLNYVVKNFPEIKIGGTVLFDLGTPHWLWIVYLGFGAGLSVFMFCGFVKAIPLEIEEAAMIDGCSPLQMFFKVVFPILKPTAITVAILNAMWIWNDYLLPYMLLTTGYDTIPIAIQKSLRGSYGSNDMGALMAMLVLTVIPIVVFYLFGQKHIIKGVVAGAVKG